MTRTAAQSQVCVNGIQIALRDWPGDGPPVLFCHGTGFHSHIWDQVIAHLPQHRCLAFDARGHGRSGKPEPPCAWRDFGADVASLAESLGLSGAIGVGHSLGGHAVTLGAALHPAAFSALVLFDPVIWASDEYAGRRKKTGFVRKRRNQWASAQEMFERFESRPPFDSWDRQVLRDYCDHALQRNGEGYILACPPEIEASIYDGNAAAESNIYAEIATIQIPVLVVRAGRYPDPADVMRTSPTTPGLASSFALGTDILTGNSHFIPMEAPEAAAKLIAKMSTLL
jgi:lipase